MRIKVCLECGQQFEAVGQERICSAECRRLRVNARMRAFTARNPGWFTKYHPNRGFKALEPIKCRWCEVEFQPDPKDFNRKFCSNKCFKASRNSAERARRKANPKVKWEKVLLECVVCGASMMGAPWTKSPRCSQLCSGKTLCSCGVEWKRRNRNQCWKCAGRLTKVGLKPVTKTCEACGKQFARRANDHGRDAGRACSRECGWKLNRSNARQRKDSKWNPGQGDRSLRKEARDKKSELIKAATECCICNLPFANKNFVNGLASRLRPTVEHIVPVSKGGDNSKANLGLAHAICNLTRHNKTLTTELQEKCRAKVQAILLEEEQEAKTNSKVEVSHQRHHATGKYKLNMSSMKCFPPRLFSGTIPAVKRNGISRLPILMLAEV